jgi:hypothetical protein
VLLLRFVTGLGRANGGPGAAIRSNARVLSCPTLPEVTARSARAPAGFRLSATGAKWSVYSVMAWYAAHRVPRMAWLVSECRSNRVSVWCRFPAMLLDRSEVASTGHSCATIAENCSSVMLRAIIASASAWNASA